jgi:hypothetical protein
MTSARDHMMFLKCVEGRSQDKSLGEGCSDVLPAFCQKLVPEVA